jgi:transposase
VDISKSHLDVFRLEDQAAEWLESSAGGFRALTRWLGKTAVARVVFERTEAYHKAFEGAFGGKFPLVKVNPWQARRFAETYGVRAKTDAVDAKMLGAWGPRSRLNPKRRSLKIHGFSKTCTLHGLG